MKVIKGIPGSPGTVCGQARVLQARRPDSPPQPGQAPEVEWRRARKALQAVREQLLTQAASAADECREILLSNAQILDDPELLGTIREILTTQQADAGWAIQSAFEFHAGRLDHHENEYLRARGRDLREIGERVLNFLDKTAAAPVNPVQQPAILVSTAISFLDLALLDEDCWQGVCLGEGNWHDHALIMARSLGIPAVIGLGNGTERIQTGDWLWLDGNRGEVRCLPGPPEPPAAGRPAASPGIAAGPLPDKHPVPACTRDGVEIGVYANVSSVRSARLAREAGADGIGLLRTEYLFAKCPRLPAEDEQYVKFQEIADLFPGREITIRLFDIGADKSIFGLQPATEANPALGRRGIRLSLARPEELLIPQIRAVLRVENHSRIRIMLPMITAVSEIRQCRRLLDGCRRNLTGLDRLPPNPAVPLGIMIEVPAAALLADVLAGDADFFSIGTNDLSQYLFAADRQNPALAGLAGESELALLRLIARVIECARTRGKSISLCGEWGQHPLHLALLIGLGIGQVSVNPSFVAGAKWLIGRLNRQHLRNLAAEALQMTSPHDIHGLLQRHLTETIPGYGSVWPESGVLPLPE